MVPTLLGTGLWLMARSESLWSYGLSDPSGPQQLFKYEAILAVFLAYATVRSVPIWWRSLQIAREDADAVPRLIAAKRWVAAARVLHRCCLLRSAVWRRVGPRAAEWDAQIRPHLLRSRRIYVYFRETPPPRPEDPTSSFTPEVFGVGVPSVWSVVALVPLIAILYFLVDYIMRTEEWMLLLSVNVVLMVCLLLGYGTFYTLLLFGRVSYVRLAPGVAQWLRFAPLRRRPRIEAFNLREHDAVLDTTGWRTTFSLVDRTDARTVHTFTLPSGADVTTACLRAVLSSAPIPPLADDQLEG
jgi:hypothetical protein